MGLDILDLKLRITGTRMSDGDRLSRGNRNRSAPARLIFCVLLGLMIALAPAFSSHAFELVDTTAASIALDLNGDGDGSGAAHAAQSGLACHAVGGCTAIVVLPEDIPIHAANYKLAYRLRGSEIWIWRSLAPDSKPPIG